MRVDRRAERVRCARCLGVVATSHAWEVVTCACGAVTVSGLPWRLRVDWSASSPGGWSYVEDADPEPEPEPDGDPRADDAAAGGAQEAPTPRIRLGYRGRAERLSG